MPGHQNPDADERAARLVLGLDEVAAADVALVGGKGAMLGELARLDGVAVPDGFVVTTAAYRATSGAAVGDGELAAEMTTAIAAAVADLGVDDAYAVRSSATAEDHEHASFAGQYESFLGVVGVDAIIEHVRRCWASLGTEHAAAYGRRAGIDDDGVAMAVVVQRMVDADASGVLFTADPISGNRKAATIEAVRGLGDALVGGTAGPADVLTDDQRARLVALGRRIEGHLGRPQDIEWCLADDEFWVVQSRPITTLFPPPVPPDDRRHVYLSVGHQQMMTDAIRPLGLSMFQLTAGRPMDTAGGRLWVDVTDALAVPAARDGLVAMISASEPLFGDALRTVVERGLVPTTEPPVGTPPRPPAAPDPITNDPMIVAELIAENEASVAALRARLSAAEGAERFAVIADDLPELKRLLTQPRSHQAVMAGMDATVWLNRHLADWLGITNAADDLTRSAPGNITSEMGLALLDVADVVREHPDVIASLERVADGHDLRDGLAEVDGGGEVTAALDAYLERFGMRGNGEIDITRPRWREQPEALVPTILAHVRTFARGEAARRVGRGRARADAVTSDVLDRLRRQPDGEARAAETEWHIERVRTFIGYREYPKYGMIRRYDLYRQALVAEAERLVAAGVLRTVDDADFLTFDEFRAAAEAVVVDPDVVDRRRADFRWFEALTPPRVLTSDGESITGSYRRTAPDGALIGLAVSTGVVEGRARVVREPGDADLAPGDILVTRFTDPSWSPMFVTVAGLVTEVGGLLSHGAVVAREYGLPAVVGVADATTLIPDGHRLRLDGTTGIVELVL